MADPITLTALAIGGVVLGAAGTAVGAIGSFQTAQANANIASQTAAYNAQLAQQQAAYSQAIHNANAAAANRDAKFIEQQAAYNSEIARRNARRIRGEQLNLITAGSGGLSGSALDLLADTTTQGEIEALAIERQGQFDAGSARYRAQTQIMQGQFAYNTGQFEASSGLALGRLQASSLRAQGTTQLTTGLLNSGSQVVGGVGSAAYTYKSLKGEY